jgi:hypothetical protein
LDNKHIYSHTNDIIEKEDCRWYNSPLLMLYQQWYVVSVDSLWSLLLPQPVVQQQHQQLTTMMITM